MAIKTTTFVPSKQDRETAIQIIKISEWDYYLSGN
jgi:hypothetical protein